MLSMQKNIFSNVIKPFYEMAAYESLWKQYGTFKTMADLFRKYPNNKPSDFVEPDDIEFMKSYLSNQFVVKNIHDVELRIHGCLDYPLRLRDAKNPIEAFYFRGNWELIENPKRIAIVGSRNVSEEGIKRTRKLVKLLVEQDYTIVSGLAKGVDTTAHSTAISLDGRTVAVIGTPVTEYYPPENKELQNVIAKQHLLISQVPIWKYSQHNYRINRGYFPERNITMSALTQATVIIEAGETSGTLIQARAALAQGRKLFILDSCFKNRNITWPEKYLRKGAIRVSDFNDILENMEI